MKFDKVKGHIGYNDEFHLYINTDTNTKYTSATTLIGKYQPKFDSKIAFFCARRDVRNGVTSLTVEQREAELLKQWSDKNKKVCEDGTRLHYVLEMMLIGKWTAKKTKEEFNLTEEEMNYVHFVLNLKLNRSGWDLICEDLLFNDHYKIAGQSDVVVVTDKYVHIHDWKFNSKPLTWDSYKGQMMEFPLHYLPNSKLNTYELQASIYMYFKCLETGLKPGTLQVHHFLDGVCTTHTFQYRKREVELMLDYFYYKNRIPRYETIDLFPGRLGVDVNGNIIRVLDIQDTYIEVMVGPTTKKLTERATRDLMSLPNVYV